MKNRPEFADPRETGLNSATFWRQNAHNLRLVSGAHGSPRPALDRVDHARRQAPSRTDRSCSSRPARPKPKPARTRGRKKRVGSGLSQRPGQKLGTRPLSSHARAPPGAVQASGPPASADSSTALSERGSTSPRLPRVARSRPFAAPPRTDRARRARASSRHTADAWSLRARAPARPRRPPTDSPQSPPTPRRPTSADTRIGARWLPVPRFMFTRNTIGNSRPLAACTVIRLTESWASMAAFDSSPSASSSR